MSKRVLILSGPTHEYIDPVRFIGNASSGKMGKALAEEAQRQGFTVEMVTGPVADENLPSPTSARIHKITSADEMLAVAIPLFPKANIIIFSAAVADYAPEDRHVEKITKSNNELVIRLRPTPDIARTLCAGKRSDQIAIGFALQTSNGEANARRKLQTKNLDGIVLNTPASLGAETGSFAFLSSRGNHFDGWGQIGKAECAARIFKAIKALG